ncbi:GAF domain-containing protein [Pedococcus sp. 5OH_020]|uniref:GAF domain-containing protein n=1 Tax=Pedococcus sp. 5OH_020 TaxID=2989814 RepID=UPI0022E9D1A2|nr:GAF domain-containing protein [Pedococcus sp. 5OH_020]
MSDRWLLIETFGGDRPPSVIGVGATPKRMVPLATILGRGRSLQAVEAAVAKVVAAGSREEFLTRDYQRRIVADPLLSYRGDVHGVWTWVGRADDEPPQRDPAGAWHFNLTTRHHRRQRRPARPLRRRAGASANRAGYRRGIHPPRSEH